MFEIRRDPKIQSWVLYGGVYPSGSIKYLTFREYLQQAPTACRGYIEMSAGSTALALDVLARKEGLPCVAVTNSEGNKKLKAAGFAGQIHLVEEISEGFKLCERYEGEGWFWPRQFTNRSIVESAAIWCRELMQTLRACSEFRDIKAIVTGFGTGATAAALQKAMGSHGYRVIALQSAPRQVLPGFRNYAEMNLGAADLFRAYEGSLEMRVSSKLSAPSCFEALCAEDFGVSPNGLLIISHDEKPAMEKLRLGSVFS